MKSSKHTLLLMVTLLCWSGNIMASGDDHYDLGITLNLDFTSFETMYHHPEVVLADPDSFIANNKAWQLIMGWHKNNRVPEKRELFLAGLTKLAAMTPAERKKLPEYKIYLEIKSKAAEFPQIALKHVKSFLPPNSEIKGKKSVIYFTAFSVPYSMMTNGNMVIDLSRERWNDGGANSILNMSVHEFFHVGYGYNRYFRQEDGFADSLQNRIVDALQNEGIATLVSYNIRNIYPATHEDYLMFENEESLINKFKMLQNIFDNGTVLSDEGLFKLAWNDGVVKRAYYVSGLYMANTIDKRLGRKALVQTIKEGPISFIDTYNRVADENLKINRFPGPDPESIPVKLKKLALEGNGDAMNKIAERIKENSAQPAYTENEFNMLGYRIMKAYKDPEAAALIFQCGIRAFPRSANLFDSLGEAWLQCGDEDKALRYYKKSLELNPNNKNAKTMIKKIVETHN